MPYFHYNLIVASKLTTPLKCIITFLPDSMTIHVLHCGKILVAGKQIRGLYVLLIADARRRVLSNKVSTKVFYGDPIIWHIHLGYIFVSQLTVLSPNMSSKVVDCLKLGTTRPLAKQTRLKFEVIL